MTRFLGKWLRKFHRFIAVPTALLIPAAFIIKLVGDPQLLAWWEKVDRIPSILMLIMAISGSYLFLLPYIAKWQRRQRITSVEKTGKILDAKQNANSPNLSVLDD